ncbi:mitochondrial 37S ribosomal protein mS42 [Lipomyces oligophaga]|uniref:mitochondrial 37S ribosomal protein mS42 n=1 Tax=Lipomyces oligophaga TaxID=45792 RepID=UPI0034CD3418
MALFRQFSRLSSSFVSRSGFSRRIHSVPVLESEETMVREGIPGLYSAQGFEIAWPKYQSYVVAELNKRTVGTKLDGLTAFETMLTAGRDLTKVPEFNFASLSHNNHLFFHGLKPSGTSGEQQLPTGKLQAAIDLSFTSIDELRDHIIYIGTAMCGNGFVWLLEGPDKKLYVTATYNAGTPYDYARNQTSDFNSPSSAAARAQVSSNERTLRLSTISKAAYSSESPVALPAEVHANPEYPLPLLCVSVWEHSYLFDYGFGKKEQYLNNWWNSINWPLIESRYLSASGSPSDDTSSHPDKQEPNQE